MTSNDIASSLGATLLAASLGQSERPRSPTPAAAVGAALDQANQRIEAQRTSTEVRLSAFSQLRSSVAQLQDSSRALSATETSDTADEARSAAEAFVGAFNAAQGTANRTINGTPPATAEGNTDGVLSGDGRANVAASELSRTLNSSSAEALRTIGINRAQDGTLNIDRQRFEQALQNAPQSVSNVLAETGQQVEQSTSRQLESSSTLSRAEENLNRQAETLEARQAQQQELADNLQQATEQATARFNFVAASGIRAYEQIFSL
jgi:flagellar capping protein FliD